LSFGGVAKATAVLLLFVGMGYTVYEQFLAKPEEKPAPASAPAPTLVAKRPASKTALSPRELAQRSLPSTVSLRCRHSVGSGFFVAPDLVLTNAHVLCPSDENVQVVTSDERKFVGQVLRANETVDLGLVRVIGAEATPLPMGDVADLAVGDKVMIIGSPVGLEFTVHEGSVSSLQRSAYGVAYVQLDAKVNPGNSGGPVIDGEGRVVGVVSLKVAGGAEGIGLALPINYAYSTELDFVDPPAPNAASSKAFARMLARAKDESSGQGRPTRVGRGPTGAPPEVTEIDDAPLLVSAHVDQYTRLVVRLVRIADREPGFEEVSVKMWSGTEAFCTIKGDVSAWTEIDPTRPGSGVDAQAGSMLKRMAGDRRLYVGESPLRWDLCDRSRLKAGIEVELEGGSSVANRLQLR
jgi:S1-C subfamily serine protease